ncbi:uncharacterized protein LOC124652598 [Lolium rigidum]|uniref:uncharacterized protein LOC124652598 n=1 Tax=Lolium rigidum TaxID=89674 RepID=UPI001F5E2A6E|nr:uncharacterized protein LOC124652598 [Lolium rigidum]
MERLRLMLASLGPSLSCHTSYLLELHWCRALFAEEDLRVANPDWWSVHLQKHPEHAKYRNAGPANLAEMHKMFDSRHVSGAQSAIPGEIPLEEITEVDDDDTDDEEDDGIKAKRRKRKSKGDDELTLLDEKNPFIRMYKKTTDAIRTTAEEISSSKTPPSLAPTMKEAMVMVRECGVQEGTPLFFSSSMLLMKTEYREMFASVETMQGRFDWLERAHDHL